MSSEFLVSLHNLDIYENYPLKCLQDFEPFLLIFNLRLCNLKFFPSISCKTLEIYSRFVVEPICLNWSWELRLVQVFVFVQDGADFLYNYQL